MGVIGFSAVSATLPNLGIIKWAIGSPVISVGEKIYFLANVLVGGYKIDLVSSAMFFTVTVAILFGINIAMVAYYFKNKGAILRREGIVGFFGAFTGFLGVGCSACGSVALSSLLSMAGIGSALSYLPLGGREFAILSIFLLLLSIYQISRKISTSKICLSDTTPSSN